MNFSDFNIHVPAGKAGEFYTTCPECSHTRKKKHIKCLSVNVDKGVWHCGHCGWKGNLPINLPRIEKPVYVKPVWRNNTELSDKVVKWFEGRGIRQHVLTEMQITASLEWMPQENKEVSTIQFNYFRDGELINTKFRDAKKNFKMVKDAEKILYNLDGIKGQTECIFVEGEMDALSFIAAGITNVVSVPNGATLGNINLDYIDNCIEELAHIDKFVMCLDNDPAGRNLKNKLSERLGREKCTFVDWEYKDANECLIDKGIDGIIAFRASLKPFPIEGVYTLSDFDQEINDLYINGLDPGYDIGMREFDARIRFAMGYVTTITGIPGHGKSDYLDQICLRLCLKHGLKGAYYSPENRPTELHISKLCRKIIGKAWFGIGRMSVEEMRTAVGWMQNKIHFIKPKNDFGIEHILDAVKQMKVQHGIDWFVIDAWNKLEHKMPHGMSKTDYIGLVYDQLAIFCETWQVHCFMVAHPRKMEKEKDGIKIKVPSLYDISDSANFANKTDNGLAVYRDFTTGQTSLHILKVKFSHWGMAGTHVLFDYDLPSGRYIEDGSTDMGTWLEPKEEPKQPILKPNTNFYEVEKDEDEEGLDAIESHFG